VGEGSTGLIEGLLRRVRGQPVEVAPRRLRRRVDRIVRRADDTRALDDDALRERGRGIAAEAAHGPLGRSREEEAFALIREVARRRIGLEPYPVQLLAGLALREGAVVEMATGEGKTLAAVAPACLAAWGGGGIHVLTFNDYLARRDAAWMGPIYRFFGLQVAAVQSEHPAERRRAGYGADVTYATAREAGFDFLRDQLVLEPGDRVQRGRAAAIVDEADSLLVDEARVPLVIAGRDEETRFDPGELVRLVRSLERGRDLELDEGGRNVFLTDAGLARCEGALGCGPLHDMGNRELLTGLQVVLHAEVLLRRDVDYIVRDGRVELVDEFTGRVREDRRWPDGLHAALQAKEGVEVEPEGRVLGSVTLQHYLAGYERLAGMTATAQPAAEELQAFYGLRTVVVPPNRPCVRADPPDRVFTHREAKEEALVAEVADCREVGRPVLVGTASVEASERLAEALDAAGIPCEVLNARNDEREAEVIAGAGAPGAVTISTNMAGRGTDIRLGGADESDREAVVAVGGLYVVGTHKHESRRIDDQLRGRAGRQGDPGESRFFVSLDDDLVARHGVLELIPERHRPAPRAGEVDDPVVGREIDRTQRIVEGQTFDIRRTLWRYSSVVEKQRRILGEWRERVLVEGPDRPLAGEGCAEHRTELVAVVGEAEVRRAERQLTVLAIDRAWADQLSLIADIREGVHLYGLQNTNPFLLGWGPLNEFNKQITEAFQGLLVRVDDRVAETFVSLSADGGGLDLGAQGFGGPGATWTYLVHDDPFENALVRVMRRFRGALGKD